MTASVSVGEPVKVSLPGEAPWVLVMEVNDDGTFLGRIDNKLFSEFSEFEKARFMKNGFGTVETPQPLHSYKFGDEVLFTLDETGIWIPAPQQGEG